MILTLKHWLQLLATSITQGLSAYWCSLARLYITWHSTKHLHPIISATGNGLFQIQSLFSPFYILSCLRFKINNNKDLHKFRVNITLCLMACVNIIQYITLKEKAFKFCVMPVPWGVKHLWNFDLTVSQSLHQWWRIRPFLKNVGVLLLGPGYYQLVGRKAVPFHKVWDKKRETSFFRSWSHDRKPNPQYFKDGLICMGLCGIKQRIRLSSSAYVGLPTTVHGNVRVFSFMLTWFGFTV